MIHPQPLKNFTILIVDDAPPPRKMLRKLLNNFGEHNCEESISVNQAQDKIMSSKSFNLIFCDIILPGANGLELLQWVRSGEGGENNKDIPFICCSSDFAKEDVNNARSLGVSGILTKPYNFIDLYRVISAIFNWNSEVRKYFDRTL